LQKIVHILYSGFGGHASVVYSYLSEPLLNDYEHHLIFFGIEDIIAEHKQFCKDNALSYEYVRKPTSFNFSYLFKLLKVLIKQKPRLVITHSLPTVPVVMLYRLVARCRLVLIEHASLELKRAIDYLWTCLGQLICHKIIYLTAQAYNESRDKFRLIFRKDKNGVISNGINLNKFVPSLNKPANDRLVLATHCRLVEVKDLGTLITAVSMVNIDSSIVLKIAGEGPAKKMLESMTEKLNISEKVTFVGLLNEDKVIGFLQSTDIYANTSKIETMSTSLMQAMACGLPCIVSDIRGNLEMIENEENGLSFKLSDPSDLAEKIERLSTNFAERKEFGEKGRKWAVGHYSNQIMADNYRKLIKEVL